MDDDMVEIDLSALGNVYEGLAGTFAVLMVGTVIAVVPACITVANMLGH